MNVIPDSVSMNGDPVTLVGNKVKVGEKAPDVTLTTNDFSEFRLSALKGKMVIVSVVPSLDTPVCDLQTKRFNQEATNLGQDVAVITVSMDLPFAQRRWCEETGSNQLMTLSDHKHAAFGEAFGVLVKEMRLLSRSVFIIDPDWTIRYLQVVPEITTEPDYNDVLEAVKKLKRQPEFAK